MQHNLPIANLLQTVPLDSNYIEVLDAMSIYQQTKEIFDSTNVALGRGVEYSIFDSSSNQITIEANECHSTTTVQV